MNFLRNRFGSGSNEHGFSILDVTVMFIGIVVVFVLIITLANVFGLATNENEKGKAGSPSTGEVEQFKP